MIQTYTLEQIRAVVESLDLSETIAEGFTEYSRGNAIIPPVGEMIFENPPGDTHIKYGYIKGQDTYVVKIASGFYENMSLGLPSSSGLMLIFSQKTGFLQSILLDDGYLTNVRTAIAGQLCSKYLAPKRISSIGILGTGVQARMQAIYSSRQTGCKRIFVWGRKNSNLEAYCHDMKSLGFTVQGVSSPLEVVEKCNLIITTTPSESPLLYEKHIQPGTHISAIGSDTPEKQELQPAILEKAGIIVTDSLAQCEYRGEIFHALKASFLNKERVLELGDIIIDPGIIRREVGTISVADLTGVAVQDIQIANAVCDALESVSGGIVKQQLIGA